MARCSRGLFVFLALGILVLQLGCSGKGLHREELRESLREGIAAPEPTFDDDQIKAEFNKKPNLPKPFRLAVYFSAPKSKSTTGQNWRWTEQDKALLEEIGKELKAEGLASDVFPILNSLVQEEDLKSLRLIAAKHQADALLVVSGAGEIDRYINKWGWSYALLLPTLFVPGSQADTLFVANATMWDVKNEYLYLTAEAEATTQDTYVAAFGKQDRDLLGSAKTQSLGLLKQELKSMLNGTKL